MVLRYVHSFVYRPNVFFSPCGRLRTLITIFLFIERHSIVGDAVAYVGERAIFRRRYFSRQAYRSNAVSIFGTNTRAVQRNG